MVAQLGGGTRVVEDQDAAYERARQRQRKETEWEEDARYLKALPAEERSKLIREVSEQWPSLDAEERQEIREVLRRAGLEFNDPLNEIER
jgi:hypothetical protein